MTKTETILIHTEPELKQRIREYSDENGISQSGAVRMILKQNLPNNKEV